MQEYLVCGNNISPAWSEQSGKRLVMLPWL